MNHDESAVRQVLHWSALAFAITIFAFWKSHDKSAEATAFVIIGSMAGIGGLALWDQDRWRKSGSTHSPLLMHVIAALLGVLASTAINTTARFAQPYLVRLFVAEFTILVFFLLLELSIDKNVRKNELYSLPGMSCWLAYMTTSPLPPYQPTYPYVDGGAIAILFAAVACGTVHVLRNDMDSVPMERKFVYIWAGISIVILTSFMLASR